MFLSVSLTKPASGKDKVMFINPVRVSKSGNLSVAHIHLKVVSRNTSRTVFSDQSSLSCQIQVRGHSHPKVPVIRVKLIHPVPYPVENRSSSRLFFQLVNIRSVDKVIPLTNDVDVGIVIWKNPVRIGGMSVTACLPDIPRNPHHPVPQRFDLPGKMRLVRYLTRH